MNILFVSTQMTTDVYWVEYSECLKVKAKQALYEALLVVHAFPKLLSMHLHAAK